VGTCALSYIIQDTSKKELNSDMERDEKKGRRRRRRGDHDVDY